MTNFTTKLQKNKTGFDFIFIRFAYYYIFLFLYHFRTGYVSVIFLVFQHHRYPIIFQKTGISLGFEREKIDFWKSDFVRFLFVLALLKIYVFPI